MAFAIPGAAIKIAPYANPLHDIMYWNAASAKLIIQNPEGESLTTSWPSTVDLWNYNGTSWTFDLPDGDKFAFSKRVDINTTNTDVAGTVRSVSITQTVTGSGAVHEALFVTLDAAANYTGSWANAIAARMNFTGTGSGMGGTAAVISAEMNLPPIASPGGSYFGYQTYYNVPTSATLIDSTSFNYAFELYELVGGAKGQFDDYGDFWNITGLTPLVDHVLSADYVTLRCLVSTLDKFLIFSTEQNKLKFINTVTNPNVADGEGSAIAVETNLAGTATGHITSLSSWVNIATAATAFAGGYVSAIQTGIWEGAATEIANARIIFGMRMHKLITDTPGRSCPFSVNTDNSGITAIFDVQTRSDLSDDDDDAETYAVDGWIPLYIDNGGNIRYIRTYK